MYFSSGKRFLATFLILTISIALGGCAPEKSADGGRAQVDRAINGGDLETGQDSVVYIAHQSGSACTGTIISPRVVLTAKHCIANMDSSGNMTSQLSASGFGIWIGASPNIGWGWNPDYTVSEVRTTPGSAITDNDMALLIIAGVMTQMPYNVVSSYSSGFVGSDVYLIGYGLDSCVNGTAGGDAGTKRRTTDQVVSYEGINSFVTQGRGAVSGDSGGPVFNTNYEVVGVMVAVPQNYDGSLQCGTTICTRVDKFQNLIQQAIEDTGGCYATGPEICGDGIDQDCSGVADDGCNAVGEACTTDSDCESDLCVDLGQGKVCSVSCDPKVVLGSCVAGYYCKEIDCGRGVCAAGVQGALEAGQRCTSDTDCETLYCKPASDGNSYCSVRCTLEMGQCLPNEVCAPMGDTCGACQYSAVYQGQRGLGEICQMGQNCRSGLCIEDQGAYYCSSTCSSNDSCPDGYHCRESQCVRGYLGSDGDPCEVTEDCMGGLTCYTEGSYAYCAQQDCETTGCPSGMTCVPVGSTSVCDLDAAPVGERCDGPYNCRTAACLMFNGDGVCTIQCGRGVPCPTGTYCSVTDDGQMACAPNSLDPVVTPPNPGGGDKKGCNASGNSTGTLPLLLGLFIWGWTRRRRRL